LCSGKLLELYSFPYIIRVAKARKMGWAEHVAHMGESRNVYRVLVGYPKGRDSISNTSALMG
jgi:hypothetical protein